MEQESVLGLSYLIVGGLAYLATRLTAQRFHVAVRILGWVLAVLLFWPVPLVISIYRAVKNA